MKIIVNGKMRDVAAEGLAALLDELDMASDHVATAVNGVFVARAQRKETRLSNGDRVEVLTPMQGG